MSQFLSSWSRVAGLIAGPAAWGLNTQVAYAVASQSCDTQRAVLLPIGLVLIAVAAAGSVISVLSARSVAGESFDLDPRGGAATRFLAMVSLGAGVLFAAVIVDQLAATMIVAPCMR
jgi:hypothetical protein